MKTLIIKIFLFLFCFSFFVPAQNWIKDYDGIPIHTGLWMGWSNVPGALDSMSKIVDVVSADIGIVDDQARNPLAQIDTLRNHGLKLIPVRTRTTINSTIYNWIQHYTDAKFCIWEAEGTSPGFGDASLEHSSNIMTEYTDADTTYLKLNLNAAGLSDTNLIWGPFYVQDAVYYASQDNITEVTYTANFRLKLDYINGIPNGNDNPNDSVCIIQVTYSTPQGTQGLACTHIVKDSTIVRSKLKYYFFDFPLIYKLNTNDCDGSSTNGIPQQNTFHSSTRRDTLLPGPRNAKEYVEFRVVWLGKPQYLLSIDKITVSDTRGQELFGADSLFHRNKILVQANTADSLNADSTIVGWLGIDEPVSIDIFEPIKLVTQLLDNNSQEAQPLWLPLMGKWDGAFRNRGDIHGAMGLSPWTEMKKRIGNMNVWQDFYLYDYPCNENSTETVCQGDWRSTNIWRMAELNYKQAYELNPNFGVSLQCGEIHNTQAYERNIGSHELLYNTNIALMYGAKFISLYSYFAQRNTDSCLSGWICRAIVDILPNGSLDYTQKYYTLRDTISPRLKGLYGKTIKQLEPAPLKFLGKDILIDPDYSSYYSYIDFIEAEGSQTDTCIVDLGLFTDPEDNSSRYFMTINRYYSTFGNMTFGLKDLSIYKNWQITDLMDTSGVSLVAYNNKVEFSDTIIPGDAKLYNILPVLRKGGTIAENDTVFYNSTLIDNMFINSAKTVYIKPGMFYTIQDTITLQGSGSSITGEGYLEVAQGGEVVIYNWTNSLFKGKQSNHPKLFWGKFEGSGHTGYKIYRKKETPGFVEIASLSNSAKTFIDTTVIIIDGLSQANEAVAEYYVKAIYNYGRSSSNSNTIIYLRVEGSAQEKQSSGLTRDNFTYQLQQNYPNPFNPITQINYSIENDGTVELEVLNILGERVASLVNEFKTKGNYTVPFDASHLASGVYVYKLQAGDFVNSKKMILLK